MNVPIYCIKQAAYCFFKTFARHTKKMTYKQSYADPCLYFSWVDKALFVFIVWVDGVMVLGPPLLVEQVQHDLEKAFTCKHKGELTKYVGSKLNFTQSSSLFNPY